MIQPGLYHSGQAVIARGCWSGESSVMAVRCRFGGTVPHMFNEERIPAGEGMHGDGIIGIAGEHRHIIDAEPIEMLCLADAIQGGEMLMEGMVMGGSRRGQNQDRVVLEMAGDEPGEEQ